MKVYTFDSNYEQIKKENNPAYKDEECVMVVKTIKDQNNNKYKVLHVKPADKKQDPEFGENSECVGRFVKQSEASIYAYAYANANMTATDLHARMGKVVVSRKMIAENLDEPVLSAIFSKFYPVATEPDHSGGMYENIAFYGYSPLFDIVEAGQIPPTYELEIRRENNGFVRVVGAKKLGGKEIKLPGKN